MTRKSPNRKNFTSQKQPLTRNSKKIDKKEAVALLLFSDDRSRVLLIKRRDVPVWVLPGGGIEVGESPEEAALREMVEETGVVTTLFRKVAEYTPISSLASFTHLFEMKWVSGSLQRGDETADLAFFDLNDLPKKIPPPYREWIEDGAQKSTRLIQKEIRSVTYSQLLLFLFKHPILTCRFLLARAGFPLNK